MLIIEKSATAKIKEKILNLVEFTNTKLMKNNIFIQDLDLL